MCILDDGELRIKCDLPILFVSPKKVHYFYGRSWYRDCYGMIHVIIG